MKRMMSRWGIGTGGALLMVWGLFAMWSGWDQIQIERGWSLFIAGATALSGGMATLAMAQVAARLEQLIALRGAREPSGVSAPTPIATPDLATLLKAEARALEPKPSPPPSDEKPVEVDRYVAGEAIYVMFSDGSVEVRTTVGAERYPSLAALRAEAEARQR